MPTKRKDDATTKLAFDFLMADYQLFADNLWKSFDKVWEIYKFYITLISGFGGILLGLLSLGVTLDTLYPIPSLFAMIIFVLGISLFVQLINIDKAVRKGNVRMMLAREKISSIASLDDYFARVEENKAEWMYWDLSYSFKSLFRRALRGAGVKTQIVVLNSLVGILIVISLLVKNINLSFALWLMVGVMGYILIVLFHVVVALMETRPEE